MNSIRTKKCLLRSPSVRDVASIARYADDKTIARNTARLPFPYTKQHARGWILKCQRRHRSKPLTDVVWLIDIAGVAVGAIGLHHIEPQHKAELGYWLGKPFRGQGIMPVATRAVLQYAKQQLHLKIVYAYTYTYNPASGRVLEKAGFSKRGVLPQFTKKDGKYVDDVIYVHVL